MSAIPRASKAPFPWFGGKSTIAREVWDRLGSPKQYIEPFCGSAAVLLAAPSPASLEVIGDQNCYVANFWRALKFQSDALASWSDYPVSHIDLFARHRWLVEPARVEELRESLCDADWHGDAKIAGWWLWGQCCWIGSGWCDPSIGKIPHVSDAGRGVQAGTLGKIPHVSDAGRGVQAGTLGQIPHVSDAGRGVQAGTLGQIPHVSSAGMGAAQWLATLSTRLARVRVVHGDWSRCLNSHYGGAETAIFLDPPYRSFEALYSDAKTPVADEVCAWAREHADLRVALCGHRGDYDLSGWSTLEWSRGKSTYAGRTTTDAECIWFSPACLSSRQTDLLSFTGGK